MRISDFGFRIRRVSWRFLIVACAAVCVEAISSQIYNPQSAIRNPHSHKIHVSVTNLEFNQPRQTVEIVIRVFTDDLENALSRRANRAVKNDPATAGNDRQVVELVMAYLLRSIDVQ